MIKFRHRFNSNVPGFELSEYGAVMLRDLSKEDDGGINEGCFWDAVIESIDYPALVHFREWLDAFRDRCMSYLRYGDELKPWLLRMANLCEGAGEPNVAARIRSDLSEMDARWRQVLEAVADGSLQ
jgi:hypothetical protein